MTFSLFYVIMIELYHSLYYNEYIAININEIYY